MRRVIEEAPAFFGARPALYRHDVIITLPVWSRSPSTSR